ncbi:MULTISPECIES: DUF2523 family protein [unclassified Pseudoalteromonas]|uniref:DUF2523 family protein n=1 Tax=unclassified Pseudoalteromonas TaxID=194690 RepID=UPI0025B56C89|nr:MULTISPECIES: DUF2523 family protein [unclassified Pseudoalteromonas]MDN3377957.1 DUF2523 family protein [Pseudoalteromonas sp. APC 3893]MDN3386152.1 DUF2523 family protein [Pseudoalteromonas sp. APC 4017]
MKIKFILLTIFFIPFFAFSAVEPSGMANFAQKVGDFFTDTWAFFDDDVPSFLERAAIYATEKAVMFAIELKIESIKFAWKVAKAVLENFQVSSKVVSAANSLPQDVKAALVDMRFFDGVAIIIQALATKFVMRFI